MSNSIFTPDHFETAKQHGLDDFGNELDQTIAELNVSLKILRNHSKIIGFNENDLASYNFLQNGTARECTYEAIDFIKSAGSAKEPDKDHDMSQDEIYKDISSPIRQLLPDALRSGRLMAPMQLGRLAINQSVSISGEGSSLVTTMDIYAENREERSGRFVFPWPGATIEYRGGYFGSNLRTLADRNQRVANALAETGSIAMSHVDEVGVYGLGQAGLFLAVSYDGEQKSHLLDLIPYQPPFSK